MQYLDIKPSPKNNLEDFCYWLNDVNSRLVSMASTKKVRVKHVDVSTFVLAEDEYKLVCAHENLELLNPTSMDAELECDSCDVTELPRYAYENLLNEMFDRYISGLQYYMSERSE